MDHQNYGGSWGMIQNVASPVSQSNSDQMYSSSSSSAAYLHQQPPPHFQPHFNQPQPQQQLQRMAPQQPPPPPQPHQSFASHFHLLHLVQNLSDAIDNGTRDQHFDGLVNELNAHFDQCQQLLNSISASVSSKSVTVEGQKRKLAETEQALNRRRELIGKYQASVEDLLKSEL